MVKGSNKNKKQKTDGRRNNGSFTSETARLMIRKRWGEEMPKSNTIRIHADVVKLAQTAWSDSRTRIAECSEAIRDRALAVLNKQFSSSRATGLDYIKKV